MKCVSHIYTCTDYNTVYYKLIITPVITVQNIQRAFYSLITYSNVVQTCRATQKYPNFLIFTYIGTHFLL